MARNHPIVATILLGVVLVGSSVRLDAQVVINEIMFSPDSPEPEWVELYNAGDSAADITAWVVHDRTSSRPRLPSCILGSGEYIVLTDDTVALRNSREAVGRLIQVSLPALNNGGDDVVLRDDIGRVADSMEYDGDWVGGKSISLERAKARLPSDERDSWAESTDSTGATPGRRNSVTPFAHDAAIDTVRYDHDARTIGTTVRNRGFDTVKQALLSIGMDFDGDGSLQLDEVIRNRRFRNLAPGDTTLISLAWDRPVTSNGERILVELEYSLDESLDNNVRPFLVRLPRADTGVIVNEFMYDPEGGPEWIELYNRSKSPVELTGWIIHDAGSARPRVPSCTVKPDSFIVVTSDSSAMREDVDSTVVILTVALPALNNSGDDIVLVNRSGTVVDSLTYDDDWGGGDGVSLERRGPYLTSSDRDSWSGSTHRRGATPGFENSFAADAYDLGIEIKEFEGSSRRLAVRIRNRGTVDADDATIGVHVSGNVDSGSSIRDLDTVQVPPLRPGDSVDIRVGTGPAKSDGVTWTEIVVAVIWSRDGNSANDSVRYELPSTPVHGGVVINEIMYDPAHDEPEWIELYNNSTDPHQLKAWTVWDMSGARAECAVYVLPPAHFVVLTDDTTAFRAMHGTDAPLIEMDLPSLNNGGDFIVLKGPFGAVLDSVSYRFHWGGGDGVSLERKRPDASGSDSSSWTSSIDADGATPGYPNSWEPFLRDVAIDSVWFDADNSIVRCVVANRASARVDSAWVHLYVRPDPTRHASEFYLDRKLVSGLDSAQEQSLTYKWDRGLTIAGERATVVALWAQDQRPANDTGTAIVRRPRLDSGVVINEVMIDPVDPEPEWIELVNTTAHEIHLQGWEIRDGSGGTSQLPESHVRAHDYIVLTDDSTALNDIRGRTGSVIHMSLPVLNNGGDELVLRSHTGRIVSGLTYRGDVVETGRSLERSAVSHDAGDSVWTNSVDTSGATPWVENSVVQAAFDVSIESITFDSYSATVVVAVANTGRSAFESAELELWTVESDNLSREGGDVLAKENVAVIGVSDTVDVVFNWPLPLTVAGDSAAVRIVGDRDQRHHNNVAGFVAREPTASDGIVINEIMYDPGDDQPEWIELYNPGPLDADLTEWGIADRSGSATLESGILPADGFVVLSRDSAELVHTWHGIAVLDVQLPSINNGGETLVLSNSSGRTVDSVDISPAWGGNDGYSLERVWYADASNDPRTWSTSVDPLGATPGIANSTVPPKRHLIIDAAWFDSDRLEVKALVRNDGRHDIYNGQLVIVRDDRATSPGVEAVVDVLDLPSLSRHEVDSVTYPWFDPLSDTGKTIRLQVRFDSSGSNRTSTRMVLLRRTPLDTGLILSEVMYDPHTVGEASGAEYVELFNRTDRAIPLNGWTVREESGNEFGLVSETEFYVMPETYVVLASDTLLYVGFPGLRDSNNVLIFNTRFGLNVTGDRVVLLNRSGRAVDSLEYSDDLHWEGIRETKGVALERVDLYARGVESPTWTSSVHPRGGTPGAENSRSLARHQASTKRLSMHPSTISPDGDGFQDLATIEWELPWDAARVSIRVLNRSGEVVGSVLDSRVTPARSSHVWDGFLQDDGVPPVGLYLLRLDAMGGGNGQAVSEIVPIIVAKPL